MHLFMKVPSRANYPGKYILLSLFFFSCATKNPQFGSKSTQLTENGFEDPKNISQTFYLVGDAGNSADLKSKQLLGVLSERLEKADTASTLLFLGDNIYPKGMPAVQDNNRKIAEESLSNQLALSNKFKGKTVFIPGNHDWKNGVSGLEAQEKFVNDFLKTNTSFLPKHKCGIDQVNLNDNASLIVIDSQWFLEDWDNHLSINVDCDIKTREQFFDELEDKLTESQNKTIILAMHHPLQSNGLHGGQFSWSKQLFPFNAKIPLPVIGSFVNFVRKTSGIFAEDLQNKKYNAMVKRIRTIIQNQSHIIVVSGHDHNLQYIDNNNIKQIISGAGSKSEAARAINKLDFSYGNNGYAVLQVLKSGASKVSFYGIDANGKEILLFAQQPSSARKIPILKEFPNKFAATKDTSVYTSKMAKRGGAYRFLWGSHFRKYYGIPVRANVVSLDTLFGGLKPIIRDGDRRYYSLRLEDKSGREYVMRPLKKSATRFLQSSALKDQAIEKDFNETYTESFILDFYTTAHPFTPFVVAGLADQVGVNHTNPALYFVPKQNSLQLFNENFGNELYLIEERPMDGFNKLKSFGKPPKIVGTDDVFESIQSDGKHEVDEEAYIRARMFDMLIGDWDRDKDQWKWGEYHENGKVIYRPIPHDRDQAFPKYDGKLLSILMNIPAFRHMKSFNENVKNVQWFNRQAYNLDLAFVTTSDEETWRNQARYIMDNLSDADIDKAFENLPKEVKDESIDKIRQQLKIRKTHLEDYASQYYKVLMKNVLIVGTENKDRFVITRDGNTTKVATYSINDTGEQLVHERTYQYPQTKELWIYGLEDEDVYELNGKGNKKIRLRLLGGQNNDQYTITKGGKVRIYDFKSEENAIVSTGTRKSLFNDYEINTYNYEKPKYNVFAGYPLAGFNPDDGVKMGGVVNYTVNGFNRYPYTQRHSIKGMYYFATSGYELSYKGIFPHAVGNWDFLFDALYTSPNFSINFFGFGNETPNYDNHLNLDYNRVKIRTVEVAPAVRWVGAGGGSAIITASFERVKVDRTSERFIALPSIINNGVFRYKNFADINAEYSYNNYDNRSNPTLGMTFSVLGGFKRNIDKPSQQFPYAESALGFNCKLLPSGKVVLATLMKGKALFDNNFEFYQAATVGGDTDLRGFRNQRFIGKQSFYQSTDIRWNWGKLRNGLAPFTYGIFGGYDYGRVWNNNEVSEKWHQAAGGGLWINGVNLFTAKTSYFYSSDGGRFSVGFGFGF